MKNEFLCKGCLEFDYRLNRKNGICLDIMVLCDHEDKPRNEEEAKVIWKEFHESKSD